MQTFLADPSKKKDFSKTGPEWLPGHPDGSRWLQVGLRTAQVNLRISQVGSQITLVWFQNSPDGCHYEPGQLPKMFREQAGFKMTARWHQKLEWVPLGATTVNIALASG